jgi:glycerol-3-phosphate acyltransferase PlsX
LGGDFGAEPNVKGAVRAVRENPEIRVLLVGDQEIIRSQLAQYDLDGIENRLETVHTSQVIEMEDEPVSACREKPDSGIVKCAELVKAGLADAFLSAGNSGAVMVASFLKLGRLKGVSRPAIATALPTLKGYTIVLDAGANAECKPHQLVEFAVMGAEYARAVLNKTNPTIGIISMGEEETKGNTLVKETIPLLKKSGLNYVGPIEGRDIPYGKVDVAVCDGFTGNVVLKVCEGLSKALFTLLKQQMAGKPVAAIGLTMAKSAFKKLKAKTDPDHVGGAPLLGVNGNVIIAHGSSSDFAIYNAIKTAVALADNKAGEGITAALAKIEQLAAAEPK